MIISKTVDKETQQCLTNLITLLKVYSRTDQSQFYPVTVFVHLLPSNDNFPQKINYIISIGISHQLIMYRIYCFCGISYQNIAVQTEQKSVHSLTTNLLCNWTSKKIKQKAFVVLKSIYKRSKLFLFLLTHWQYVIPYVLAAHR